MPAFIDRRESVNWTAGSTCLRARRIGGSDEKSIDESQAFDSNLDLSTKE